MSLQTGGVALGDTSTISRFRSRAISSARPGGITPIISPFSSIKRTSRARMRSFTRVSRGRSFPRKSLLIGQTSSLEIYRSMKHGHSQRTFQVYYAQRPFARASTADFLQGHTAYSSLVIFMIYLCNSSLNTQNNIFYVLSITSRKNRLDAKEALA